MDTELFNFNDNEWAAMRNYIAQYSPANLGLMGEVKQKCFRVIADGPIGHWGYSNRTFCVFPEFIISYVTMGVSRSQYDIERHTLGSFGLRCLKYAKLCYYQDDTISKVLTRFQSANKSVKSTETQSVLMRREVKKEILSSQSELLRSNEQKEIYGVQKLRQQLKKDEDELFLKKQGLKMERTLFDEVFEEAKQSLRKERQAFEKEKQELKMERTLFDEVFEEAKQSLRKERQAFEKEKHNLETELAKYKGIVENCRKEIESYMG